MRPENTAGVARAVVEHGLFRSPIHGRLYYIGPQFRYERPQKGRYRQFHQIGAEVIGDPSPGADAETIAMVVDFLERAGVLGLEVQLNSVGCPACRPLYVKAITNALAPRIGELCGDCKRRLETNPLRLLDCKVPSCRPILDSAPPLSSFLCEGCSEHHSNVKKILKVFGVAFSEAPRLVRGLDYYTRTVFEITSSALGAQDAIVGGGRYDGLLEDIGGPAVPAFGWALGMERLLMAVPSDEGELRQWTFLAWRGEEAYKAALVLAQELRREGRVVVMDHVSRSFKSAFKRADRMGVRWVVAIGEDEAASGNFTLKDMAKGTQKTLSPAELKACLVPEREP